MDPKFNAEWSASEISTVRSLAASHIANNNKHADDKNKEYDDIVNDLHARFPWKEKHQVIELFVELVVEMLQPTQPMVEDPMTRFWTADEHREFLRGLRWYGWGNWKGISEYFVTTKMPAQISIHAQKCVRRLERTYEEKRYKINKVRLHDAEPSSAQNNSSSGGQASSSQGHLD